MITKKFQVFISSTYSDLSEERQAAVEAILKAGHIPAGMELFAAGDTSQMETIKRWIEGSDIYMLILGGRYGSIEKSTGLSYIELEYDYAVSLNKPIFAIVIKEDLLDRKVKKKGRIVLETDHPQEYKIFREKVLNKISAFFSDPKDIKLAVHESIPDINNRCKLTGWVSAADVQDARQLISEIRRLTDENAILKSENSDFKSQLLNASSPEETKNKEFDELMKLLEKIEVETTAIDKNGKLPKKISIDNIIWALREHLVTGITNQHGIDDIDKLLYFNVCPKMQIHGLMINERVPGVQYRRFSMTKKGTEFLAYVEKKELADNKKVKSRTLTKSKKVKKEDKEK